MKKVITLLLVSMLVFSLLSGCSKSVSSDGTQGTDSNPATTTAAPATAPAKTEEPVTLTMMVQSQANFPLREDWVVWKAHEKNANVKLEVSAYQGNWWDAIPLVVASRDMPDLMWMVLDDANKYGGQGALVNLLDEMDSMPNLKAFTDANPDQATPLLSADGKLYLHPSFGAYGEYDGLYIYRKDIFEKNNLALPKDFDELYTVLKKLKEIYPDSTPLFFPRLYSFTTFGYSFETSSMFHFDPVDRKVKYGPIQDNFKKLLEFVVKAYNEKLIPAEFENQNTESDRFKALLTTDRTFIYYGYLSSIDNYNSTMRETNPDFTLAFMPPPKGPTGKAYCATEFLLGEGLVVTATSKNKEAALKYIDYLFTEEGQTASSWGEEGVTYEVVNGKKQFLPVVKDLLTAYKEFGLFTSGNTAFCDPNARQALLSEETSKAYQEGLQYMAPMAQLPPLTTEENDSISIKSDAISKYVNETLCKFIFGQIPLSEWDNYVENAKKLGVEDVLKIYNDAQARADAALGKIK